MIILFPHRVIFFNWTYCKTAIWQEKDEIMWRIIGPLLEPANLFDFLSLYLSKIRRLCLALKCTEKNSYFIPSRYPPPPPSGHFTSWARGRWSRSGWVWGCVWGETAAASASSSALCCACCSWRCTLPQLLTRPPALDVCRWSARQSWRLVLCADPQWCHFLTARAQKLSSVLPDGWKSGLDPPSHSHLTFTNPISIFVFHFPFHSSFCERRG